MGSWAGGDDTLVGDNSRNDLRGGAGNDTLDGRLSQDVLDGGGGIDTATYAGHTGSAASVAVTLDGLANDGNQEDFDRSDNVMTENVVGTAGPDALVGDGAANLLDGGGGNDTVDGGLGGDTLLGGDGTDLADYSARTIGVEVESADRPPKATRFRPTSRI